MFQVDGRSPEPAARLAAFTASATPLDSAALPVPARSLLRVNFSVVAPEGARAEENAAGLNAAGKRQAGAATPASLGQRATPAPRHGYLPFPGTPTKAATLMCTFRRWADRTHRSKEPVDSLSFLRAGRGACWGGRWRPQDKGGETTGRIPSLTCQYHRPLPPTPETCELVSVLRV